MSDANWLAQFDADDRQMFFGELREATDRAEQAADITPVDECLSAWKMTAEALSVPEAREVLTGSPVFGNFVEVGPPGDVAE